MKIFCLIGAVSLLLAGCGGDSKNNTTPKAFKVNLDGNYELSQVSCTVGDLDEDFSVGLAVIEGMELAIQGASLTIVTVIDESCTITAKSTISDIIDSSISTIEGPTTYSESCPSEFKEESGESKADKVAYSTSGKTLTIISSNDEDGVCVDPEGVLVHTWSKK